MIGPPYSKDFYCIMIKLIEPFDVVLEAQSDTRLLIRQFLGMIELFLLAPYFFFASSNIYLLNLVEYPQNLNDNETCYAISRLKKCFS